MAINPDNITTIRVDQLADVGLTLDSLFPHTSGTELTSSTIQTLADLVATTIEASDGVGFLAESRTDGQTLPDIPTNPSFMLVGIGTFGNLNGYADLVCTAELNALMSLTDHWEIAVQIPISPLAGTVQSVTGTAVDNTDPLNPVINTTGGAVSSVNGDTGAVVVDLESVLTEGGTATDLEIRMLSSISDDLITIEGIGSSIGVTNPITSETALMLKTEVIVSETTPTSQSTRILKDRLRRSKGSFYSDLLFTDPTANRSITFKDESGTVALLSDVDRPTEYATADHVFVNSDMRKYLIDFYGATITLNAGVFDDNAEIIYRNTSGASVDLVSGVGVSIFADNSASPTNPIIIPDGYLVTIKKDGNTEGWEFNMQGYSASSGGVSDGDKGDIIVSALGTVWTIENGVVTDAKVASGIDAVKLADGSVSNTELQYINSLSSNAQTQLDGKVSKSDYTPAHSILVQQSGTGTPSALAIGNNTLVGRLSGGGSDINDLSVSDVRTLLSIDTDLALKQPKNIKQGYTQLTGVTGTQVIASILIPANTYASGDGFEILMTPNKSVTASAITFGIYHDTSLNGVTNAIATGANLTTSQRTGYIHRPLVLDGTTLRNVMPISASSLVPIAGNTLGATTTFNPAVDNYITITVNPTVSSEICGFNQLVIRLL